MSMASCRGTTSSVDRRCRTYASMIRLSSFQLKAAVASRTCPTHDDARLSVIARRPSERLAQSLAHGVLPQILHHAVSPSPVVRHGGVDDQREAVPAEVRTDGGVEPAHGVQPIADVGPRTSTESLRGPTVAAPPRGGGAGPGVRGAPRAG